jgi:hypothetical protein
LKCRLLSNSSRKKQCIRDSPALPIDHSNWSAGLEVVLRLL